MAKTIAALFLPGLALLGAWLLLLAATGAPGRAAETGSNPSATALSVAGMPDRTQPGPVLTAKERLGGKARDEQRVNDCKVPPKARTKPRPTCPQRDDQVTAP
jgi:hypothetical protein